jgi:TRAP-type C4-dicarboxylate transport system substrate-binding protein
MKKVFVFTLMVLIMASLIFGGCSNNPSATTTSSTTPASTTVTGQVKVTKLSFSNYLPPSHPLSKFFDNWAKEFEQKTGGRYKVEVIHGGALAGMPQSYSVARDGIADISFFSTQDIETPFPLAAVPTLPFGYSPGDVAMKVWYDKVISKGYLDKELVGVKRLYASLGTVDEVLTKKQITTLKDLKGMKLATGGGVSRTYAIDKLGIVPVFAGPPDAGLLLDKGTVDGVYISVLGVTDFQWDVDYIINPTKLGRSFNYIAMNEKVYNGLPADIKTILDQMDENGKTSIALSKVYEDFYHQCLSDFLSKGGKEINWSQADMDAFNAMMTPLWESWIKEKESQGLPAREIVNAYYNGLKDAGINNPAVGYVPTK